MMNYNNLNCEELNDLDYEIAFLVDKRTFWQYYYDVVKKDHIIIFTFIIKDDYNLRYIKILLFIASFGLFFTIEGFFLLMNQWIIYMNRKVFLILLCNYHKFFTLI